MQDNLLTSDLRAKAAELTEPCSEPGCTRISTTECGKCNRYFCEWHEDEHDCEAVDLLEAYERDREQEAIGRDTLAERED